MALSRGLEKTATELDIVAKIDHLIAGGLVLPGVSNLDDKKYFANLVEDVKKAFKKGASLEDVNDEQKPLLKIFLEACKKHKVSGKLVKGIAPRHIAKILKDKLSKAALTFTDKKRDSATVEKTTVPHLSDKLSTEMAEFVGIRCHNNKVFKPHDLENAEFMRGVMTYASADNDRINFLRERAGKATSNQERDAANAEIQSIDCLAGGGTGKIKEIEEEISNLEKTIKDREAAFRTRHKGDAVLPDAEAEKKRIADLEDDLRDELSPDKIALSSTKDTLAGEREDRGESPDTARMAYLYRKFAAERQQGVGRKGTPLEPAEIWQEFSNQILYIQRNPQQIQAAFQKQGISIKDGSLVRGKSEEQQRIDSYMERKKAAREAESQARYERNIDGLQAAYLRSDIFNAVKSSGIADAVTLSRLNTALQDKPLEELQGMVQELGVSPATVASSYDKNKAELLNAIASGAMGKTAQSTILKAFPQTKGAPEAGLAATLSSMMTGDKTTEATTEVPVETQIQNKEAELKRLRSKYASAKSWNQTSEMSHLEKLISETETQVASMKEDLEFPELRAEKEKKAEAQRQAELAKRMAPIKSETEALTQEADALLGKKKAETTEVPKIADSLQAEFAKKGIAWQTMAPVNGSYQMHVGKADKIDDVMARLKFCRDNGIPAVAVYQGATLDTKTPENNEALATLIKKSEAAEAERAKQAAPAQKGAPVLSSAAALTTEEIEAQAAMIKGENDETERKASAMATLQAELERRASLDNMIANPGLVQAQASFNTQLGQIQQYHKVQESIQGHATLDSIQIAQKQLKHMLQTGRGKMMNVSATAVEMIERALANAGNFVSNQISSGPILEGGMA